MDHLIFSFFDMKFMEVMAVVGVYIFLEVLAMLLFRFVLNKHFKSGWRYAIWIIAPLMFLFPFRIEMPYTVIPALIFDQPLYIAQLPPIEHSGITEVESFCTNGEEPFHIMVNDVLIWVWLAIALICFAVQMIKLFGLGRSVKRTGIPCADSRYNEILAEQCKLFKLKPVPVIIYPSADTPFAMGIFKPRIILPEGGYSDEEIRYIFRHELVHIKRRDILIKLFLIIFRCMWWFNPFAYIMCKLAFEDMEITCDERAVKDFSDEERTAYSHTILKGASDASASRRKYSAVTTLSIGGKSLKRRIAAVLSVKKLSSAIPFIFAFMSVIFISGTVYGGDFWLPWYYYNKPYPFESDPYLESEDWQHCTADNYTEAGEKIFRQYMEMYMAPDVPDYLRIEEYYITEIGSTENMDWEVKWGKGFLNSREFISIIYNIEFANKCGNSVHNMNFGTSHFNGTAHHCYMTFEIKKEKGEYHLASMGTTAIEGSIPWFHFRNALLKKGTVTDIEKINSMAQSGLLDYNWDTSENFPQADDAVKFHYLTSRDNPFPESDYIRLELRHYALMNAEFSSEFDFTKSQYVDSENRKISYEEMTFKNSEFIYSGFDYNAESGIVLFYGNVVSDEESHGVCMRIELEDWIYRLKEVTVRDELYPLPEYNDSFSKIPLPNDLTTAEEILEYMKTPRDGCDFTVLDYRNITEEDGVFYAEVNFKGRLEGVYSSDIKSDDIDGNEYIKAAVCAAG